MSSRVTMPISDSGTRHRMRRSSALRPGTLPKLLPLPIAEESDDEGLLLVKPAHFTRQALHILPQPADLCRTRRLQRWRLPLDPPRDRPGERTQNEDGGEDNQQDEHRDSVRERGRRSFTG